MTIRDDITPMIITYNEVENIRRTLAKLDWATQIVVVDSGSTDGTLEILKSTPRLTSFHRDFDDAASQCNFGLSKIKTQWVLSLDADYELSDELIAELATVDPSRDQAGYSAGFVYRIFGRALRGTLYPPRVVLYRQATAHYVNEGHTQRVRLDGAIGKLRGRIFHDDRKSLSRWLSSQQRYAQLQAAYLMSAPRETLRASDKVRLRAWPAPFLVFVYALVVKACVLDGVAGWYYVLQRVMAETLIALALVDLRLRERVTASNGRPGR